MKSATNKNSEKPPVFAFWRRFHAVAGVIVTPFLLVAALTGFFYALAPTLEQAVYHDEMTAASHAPARPLADQVRAAQEVHPDLELSEVEVSDDPAATTRVLFADATLPNSSYSRAVFIDPGDASVRGDLVQYGSARALPLRTWLSEGHRSLWLGSAGRWYSELAASWMGALAIVGTYLWCARKKCGTSRRQKVLTWHSRVGIVLLPGLLFLTVTGLTWSGVAGGNIGTLREHLDWMPPQPTTQVDTISADPARQVDTVARVAREQGLTGLINLTPPTADNGAWIAAEARESYKPHMNAVTIDAASGTVIDRVDFADWPLPAKLSEWLVNAHMGFLFGIWNQLALAAVAAGLGGITVAGVWMWFQRRGKQTRRPLPADWRLWAPLAAYSVIAPLFGASLLLFLGVEALISRLRA